MRLPETQPEWRYLYAALVFAVAAFFLFGVRASLTPLIAYILLVLLLTPFAGSARHTNVLIAATLALALWLLDSVGALLAPFILGFVLAYILDPAADVLERRGLNRPLAVAILLVPMISVVVLILVIGIPALINQFESLLERLPVAARAANDWLEQLRTGARRIPLLPDDVLRRWLDEERIAAYVPQRQDVIASQLWSAITGVGRGFSVVLSILGYVVLTPVLVVYLLRDFDGITRRVRDLVPEQRRTGWLAFMKEYDALLSRFLRGQVLMAALVGVLTWLGLWIAGVPYSGLVGTIAGVFNLVPYLGLVVSVVPVFIIAIISGSFVSVIVKAAIVFAIVQAIDGAIVGPRIVGGSVGLHPVWVILALALGGAFFGFVGLLIAMPAAVLFKLLLRDAVVRYRNSALFLGDAPSP
jgi:predicted PurR-regulated permease PerM